MLFLFIAKNVEKVRVFQFSAAPPNFTVGVQLNCNDVSDPTSVNITIMVSKVAEQEPKPKYNKFHLHLWPKAQVTLLRTQTMNEQHLFTTII